MEELARVYQITKASILNQVSEEQIFNFYLSEFGITVNVNGKKYCNPLRNDKGADCNFAFAKKNNKLLFFDWAFKIYSCFDIVIAKYNLSFNDALKRINEDIPKIKLLTNTNLHQIKSNTVKVNKVKNKEKQLRIKRKLYSKKELAFWEIEGLNITPMTLQKNKIYAIESYQVDENFFKTKNIAFAYHWHNYNYQIYFPFGISQENKLKFLISANLTIGDEEFMNPNANHLIITKSKKDAFYLRQFGLNAIFIVREKTLIDAFTMAEYKKKYPLIFLLGDNDYTGIKFLKTYRKEYPDVVCLFFNRRLYKKDFTDNLKFFGVTMMKQLIESTKQKYNI